MKSEDQKTTYNSEITKEDKKILGDQSGNLRQDNGDDEILKKRKNKPDFAANDLDIPGGRNARPLTNDRHADEENRHHSLGSEHNENLEQDIDQAK
ncbi:hypothetical protein HSX10_15850 [Winogradskyella undariae]|uniref:hypothetical protein n=1 Tax=Winogradskyella TaxID=286104 RepID=UPI00156B27E5|nr:MULTISPECIES: hypothetical protein [Winogradskyella]NRR93050.1 hypothetical protein [Winogradskyella undariae]QNK77602.1 hypothetical protein H7F37_00475 [Winogradskyella sp. PAMC22761]QXP79336.1 hypothetical protein H0I32_01400 [Winogradskyella sp. HaHa_3_26]